MRRCTTYRNISMHRMTSRSRIPHRWSCDATLLSLRAWVRHGNLFWRSWHHISHRPVRKPHPLLLLNFARRPTYTYNLLLPHHRTTGWYLLEALRRPYSSHSCSGRCPRGHVSGVTNILTWANTHTHLTHHIRHILVLLKIKKRLLYDML